LEFEVDGSFWGTALGIFIPQDMEDLLPTSEVEQSTMDIEPPGFHRTFDI
jgi:hypothetical protein